MTFTKVEIQKGLNFNARVIIIYNKKKGKSHNCS